MARVEAWRQGYPSLAAAYRDSNGRGPRHSFFFPGDEYRPQYLDALGSLVQRGHGEVEVHLHHDGDTRQTLRDKLQSHLAAFAEHGHLSRVDGRFGWAFIHGNWCLANSRPDGRWCGVDDELPLLFELGCYADFTFPSAPDASQPPIVNQIYWPTGDLTRRRAFFTGEPARVGHVKDDRLLMIQGPLGIARKGRLGVRLENGAITGADPPSAARVASWAAAHIHVQGRPEWLVIKVHTHGAIERTAASLLGEGGRALHTALTSALNDGQAYRLHYVTARELYNVCYAAMDGKAGDPSSYFDYRVPPPPLAAR